MNLLGGNMGQFAQPKNIFRGTSIEMNGHVFQTHSERVDPQQFTKTMEASDAYAAKHLLSPGDLNSFFKSLEITESPAISDLTPTEKLSDFNKQMWDNAVDKQHKRKVLIHDNLTTLYIAVWGQCSEAMQAKLEVHPGFENEDLRANCQWLLKEIKGIIYKFDGQCFIFLFLNESLES
jgi:hypothetical protein